MGGIRSTYGADQLVLCVKHFSEKIRKAETTWKTQYRWEDNIKINPKKINIRMWTDTGCDPFVVSAGVFLNI